MLNGFSFIFGNDRTRYNTGWEEEDLQSSNNNNGWILENLAALQILNQQ